MSPPSRVIFHVDMDAFYAAIEQRDNPQFQGHPVIVGGAQKRGVVATASYEARRYGVHSAMPMAQALKRCPHAIVVPVRMKHYADVSRQFMSILERFSPLVEPLSLDEAFLDMTGTENLLGSAKKAANTLKEQVKAQTLLTCSVGIGDNKFLAKLASDLQKPDGLTIIEQGQGASFIAPLPIRRLWGVGPKTEARLQSVGLQTIGDVARASPSLLQQRVGPKQAQLLQQLARGLDDRPVVGDRKAKSIGSEETFEEDIVGRKAIAFAVRFHCHRVAERLRQAGLVAGTIRVKVRYSQGFRLVSREAPTHELCDDSQTLASTALGLLDHLDMDSPIRLIGVAASRLEESQKSVQPDLFEYAQTQKRSQLEHTLDAIRDRFGDVIGRANDKKRE